MAFTVPTLVVVAVSVVVQLKVQDSVRSSLPLLLASPPAAGPVTGAHLSSVTTTSARGTLPALVTT